jgi:hypothetical protein
MMVLSVCAGRPPPPGRADRDATDNTSALELFQVGIHTLTTAAG